MYAYHRGYSTAVFQTTLTKASHRQFHDAVVQNACGSNAILPQFWETTLRFQIAIVVLQAVGSIALGIVAWRLASVCVVCELSCGRSLNVMKPLGLPMADFQEDWSGSSNR